MINREQIEKQTARVSELETALSDPDTVRNRKKYRDILREHSVLKKLEKKSETYFRLLDNIAEHRELMNSEDADPELKDLASEELGRLEEAIVTAEKNLTVALLPADPGDERNAIMEIRAGTGGDEAALFAGDLFRMYGRYAEAKGWKVALIDASAGVIGGYKEAIFSVEGDNVYASLKYESGGHRVQRVPVTESQGRIHTSAATIAVFPEVEPEDDLKIAPDEIRIDIFRSSGPGGQSVNTTDSAVRITHLETGITVQCQDEKSQHRNKEKAMRVLKARVLDMKKREEEERMGQVRRSQIGSGDRSERVRTYNFPQNRLTDHRVNLTLYSLDRIMEGEIDDLVTALHDHDIAMRLETLGDGSGDS